MKINVEFSTCVLIRQFMRIGLICIVSLLTTLQLLLAYDSRGQTIADVDITLSFRNQSPEEAFRLIEQATPFRFVYRRSDLRDLGTFSLPDGKRSVDKALALLLDKTPLSYRQVEKKILLKKKEGWEPANAGILASDAEIAGQPADAIRLNGTVLSAETGQPLEGASIKVTGRGGALPKTPDSQTDAEGRFALYTSLTEGVIQVSYIGYQTQTIRFGPENNGPFTIRLEGDESSLQEVEINAGYYKVTDRERTGSIVRVDAKTIEKQPVLNVLEALKGQMAGVDIQQFSGDAGGRFVVRIRGQNSLRPDANEPLYLIDGVPFTSEPVRQYGNTNNITGNPLNTLNPGDIASIEVLKDADATAIYGSRGANGVVLITTRKGRPGQARFTADVSAGKARIRRFTKLLDTEQYLEMRREAFSSSGEVPLPSFAKDMLLYDSLRYTDWQQTLLGGTAGSFHSGISLTGGAGGITYLMSGNYQKQENVYPGKFGYQRGSGRVSLSQSDPAERFQAQVSLTYTLDKNDLPDGSVNLVNSALTLPPNAPAMLDALGRVNWEGGIYSENPMVNMAMPYTHHNQNSNLFSQLSYRIMTGITAKASLGYNRLRSDEQKLAPASSWNPADNPTSGMTVVENAINTWNAEPEVHADLPLGNGRLQALLGATIQAVDADGRYLTGNGFINEQLLGNLALAGEVRASAGRSYQYRYLAAFGRLNYGYAGRYFANITARRDGSSRFGSGKQWGNFGAVGLAWIFSEEEWLKDRRDWLSYGKLRTSYGVTGSDQIADYGYMATYTINNVPAYQTIVASPSRLANADFRWENNRKLEAALEAAFFKERIRATVAWYRNRSGDQLVGYPLPLVSGFTTVQYNLPALVQNRGWEVELHTVNLSGSRWEWRTGVMVSFPQRKLLAFPGIENTSYATMYQVGENMDRSYRYKYTGVDTETGVYTFMDQDGNGSITAADRVWMDKPATMYGGIQNEVSAGPFSLSIYMQFDRRERQLMESYAAPGLLASNQPVGVMERWRNAGEETGVQKFWASVGPAYTAYNQISGSDAWYQPVTFLRLSNVTVDYTVPATWAGRVGARQLRLFVRGQNLWVSDQANRFDPETAYNQMPPLRTVIGGVQFTF